jgi:hypothetical protein
MSTGSGPAGCRCRRRAWSCAARAATGRQTLARRATVAHSALNLASAVTLWLITVAGCRSIDPRVDLRCRGVSHLLSQWWWPDSSGEGESLREAECVRGGGKFTRMV